MISPRVVVEVILSIHVRIWRACQQLLVTLGLKVVRNVLLILLMMQTNIMCFDWSSLGSLTTYFQLTLETILLVRVRQVIAVTFVLMLEITLLKASSIMLLLMIWVFVLDIMVIIRIILC